MKINNILYVLREDLEILPPAISQIVTLCKHNYRIQLVTVHASNHIRDFFKGYNVEFLTAHKESASKNSKISKIVNIISFRKVLKKALKSTPYDLIWVGSVDTAKYCKDILEGEAPKVLNIYELYDKRPEILNSIKALANASSAVVVPEYNRAHILKVWLGLSKTPVIIPNKPSFPSIDIQPETKRIVDRLKALDKKIILYQGWIGRDRDVSKIAQALGTMEDGDRYALVLMGQATNPDTIKYMQSMFKNTIHIPFLKPPQHLFITETAYMGVATYDDSTLNNIFCAPNKIYEYAEKNVPILARDIPGLSNTVGKFKAGVCVDTNDISQIASAIRELDANHEKFVLALDDFANEYNIEDCILKIINDCEAVYKNE